MLWHVQALCAELSQFLEADMEVSDSERRPLQVVATSNHLDHFRESYSFIATIVINIPRTHTRPNFRSGFCRGVCCRLECRINAFEF